MIDRVRAWWDKTFTLHRWALNPFQMYDITLLAAAAIAQIQLGATPISVQADLDRKTLVYLAITNIVGSVIALYGLHLKDLEGALWVEMCGYVILVFVLGVYVGLLVTTTINPSAAYGFALSEAFVFAAIHRSVQILLYKRARRKANKIQDRMKGHIDIITPSHPVMGEGELTV